MSNLTFVFVPNLFLSMKGKQWDSFRYSVEWYKENDYRFNLTGNTDDGTESFSMYRISNGYMGEVVYRKEDKQIRIAHIAAKLNRHQCDYMFYRFFTQIEIAKQKKFVSYTIDTENNVMIKYLKRLNPIRILNKEGVNVK